MADVLAPNPLTSKSTDVLLPDVKKDPFASQVLTAAKAKGEMDAAKAQEELYGKSELAKAEADTTKKYAEEREPPELKTKLESAVDEVGKPFVPTQQTAGDLALMFTMTNILGFLIGGGAKGNAQAALSAQNGMLEGYQKGQMDVYKKQKDIFDENQKALAKTVEGLRDQLKRAADTAAVNKELGMAQARDAISQHSANTMKEYLEKNGIAATYELAEKAWQMNEKLQEKKRQEEDRATRLAHERVMEGFKREELDLQKAKLGGMGKIDREVLNEAQKFYPELKPESLTNLSKEGVKRVVGSLDTIKSIESVANYIKQNPQSVGASAKIKNLINLDAIKSITGDDQVAAEQKQSVLDSQIDNAVQQGKISADEARSAKVLNKMLFTVALSDVQSSGQRGSIYLDKSFSNIYDQASRLGTLADILHRRIEDADRKLGVVDMNIENRSDKESFPLTTQGSEQWMNENFPKLTPQDVEKKLKDGTLKNGSWFRGMDDIPRQINLRQGR